MSAPGSLPLFVINLDRSPERLQRFLADNSVPGATIFRVSATDGQTLNRSELVASKLIEGDLAYSNNAIACYLSHLRCWREIIKRGKPAVICEDDVVIRRDFAEMHERFAEFVEGRDVVFWGVNRDMHVAYDLPGAGVCTSMLDHTDYRTEARIDEFKQDRTVPNLFRMRRAFGACCYTVTPAGARRLIKLLVPIRNANVPVVYATGMGDVRKYNFQSLGVDMDIGLVHVDEIDAYVAMPPIAIPRNEQAVSTIGAGHWKDRLHSVSTG